MKLNIRDKKIAQRIGVPFWYWANYGQFTITEKDLRYFSIIREHPCFSIIRKYPDIQLPKLEWINLRINEIVFYERFYYDPECPQGVKNVLFCIIGNKRRTLEDSNMLELLEYRYPYVEQWLNSITQKSSP